MNGYGKKLKWMIKSAGYSQKDFAVILGVSESTLSRWIMKDVPELDGIVAVCGALNVPLAKFFAEKNDVSLVLSDSEKELLSIFKVIRPEKQAAVIEFLRQIVQ
jgi:transcriptional regulator with XRE-family HTH domain